jgi:predicted amidohydrolase
MRVTRYGSSPVAVILTVVLLVGVNRAKGDEATLRVAVAQLPVVKEISKNAAAIHRALDAAIEGKAEILLTPEGSLSGYAPKFDQREVDKQLEAIVKRASAAGIALALGTCYVEPDDQKCYNEIRFYNASGRFLGFHTKTLLCSSLSDPPKGEINHYATRPLQTFEIKGITVGGLICNDMWGNPQCTSMPDPHLSQRLSNSGARIIFLAINGGRNGGDWSENVNWPYHEVNMRMRARAGKVWVVSTDNCYPTTLPCSAPSGVLGPDGQWAAKAPRQGEQVVIHTIRLK